MSYPTSQQFQNLLDRYGVTTKRDLLRAIAREYTEETGERHTQADAELLLDPMLEAEYQRIAGGAYNEPAAPDHADCRGRVQELIEESLDRADGNHAEALEILIREHPTCGEMLSVASEVLV